MRKFITFKDGTTVELSPLTYSEFVALDHWAGGSDTSFDAWLRHNNFVEADSYREEVLEQAVFWLDMSALPSIEFNTEFEDENWHPYVQYDLSKGNKLRSRSNAYLLLRAD